MGTAARLGSSLEALAAVAAYLRVETEQLTVDPRVHDLLRAIAVETLGEEPGVTRAQGAPVVGMTRALLAMSAALVDAPERPAGWTPDDDALLQGIGRQSAAIGGIVAAAGGELDGLTEALARPGAALLDVGTGTGWLAMAFAQAFPAARVVGIDIYERSLALARRNVAAAGLADRVELRIEDATHLAERDTYDAIWLPMPFLPRAVVPAIVDGGRRCAAAGRLAAAGHLRRTSRPALPAARRPAHRPRRRSSVGRCRPGRRDGLARAAGRARVAAHVDGAGAPVRRPPSPLSGGNRHYPVAARGSPARHDAANRTERVADLDAGYQRSGRSARCTYRTDI